MLTLDFAADQKSMGLQVRRRSPGGPQSLSALAPPGWPSKPSPQVPCLSSCSCQPMLYAGCLCLMTLPCRSLHFQASLGFMHRINLQVGRGKMYIAELALCSIMQCDGRQKLRVCSCRGLHRIKTGGTTARKGLAQPKRAGRCSRRKDPRPCAGPQRAKAHQSKESVLGRRQPAAVCSPVQSGAASSLSIGVTASNWDPK